MDREKKGREISVQNRQMAIANGLADYVYSWSMLRNEILTELPHPQPEKRLDLNSLSKLPVKQQWMKVFLVRSEDFYELY
jgi:hypothetical protein